LALAYFRGFLKYRGLLWEFVERDIKTRYRRSVLGLFWTLLNPLLTMAVMTAVFSTLFRSDIQNFPVYLLSGFTIYNFFSESTNNAMTSIISGSSLIKKIYIPKYLFPLSKIISTLVNLIASFIALIFVMLATGARLSLNVIFLLIPMAYIFLFALGVGLILSSLVVFFRDIAHFYGVLLLLWMYMTPLFYPMEILPDLARRIVQMNPLTGIVEYTRVITLYGTLPPPELNIICLIPGVIACMLGLWIFYHTQDRFILHV
jgi:ABC-type polysaccharide/polyol phosphate export permease